MAAAVASSPQKDSCRHQPVRSGSENAGSDLLKCSYSAIASSRSNPLFIIWRVSMCALSEFPSMCSMTMTPTVSPSPFSISP